MNQPAFPSATASLLLEGPSGKLEAVVELPEEGTHPENIVAIVCHPLSTDGGTMNNKVVTMTAKALRELGITTVRFNFRSVGQSEGAFDFGNGESDDLRAVNDWVRTNRPGWKVWFAGFSFGSYVTFRNAMALHADALISIAPPMRHKHYDFDAYPLPRVPWLVLMGEADEVVPPQGVFDFIDALPVKPQLIRFADTGHFFHRRLIDLRNAIQQAARAWLP